MSMTKQIVLKSSLSSEGSSCLKTDQGNASELLWIWNWALFYRIFFLGGGSEERRWGLGRSEGISTYKLHYYRERKEIGHWHRTVYNPSRKIKKAKGGSALSGFFGMSHRESVQKQLFTDKDTCLLGGNSG